MNVTTVLLPDGARAVHEARRAVDAEALGLPRASSENLRLMVSELVTNSLRHARDGESAIALVIDADSERIRVEVQDSGPGFDDGALRVASLRSGSGWGLFLVDALSERWGVEPGDPTRVWFEVSLNGAEHDGVAVEPAGSQDVSPVTAAAL